MAPFSPVVDKAHENSNNYTSFSACYASAVGAYDKTDGHQVACMGFVEASIEENDALRMYTNKTTIDCYANQVGTYMTVELKGNEWVVSAQTLSKSTTGYSISSGTIRINGWQDTHV